MRHQLVTLLALPWTSLAPGLCDSICAMDCEALEDEVVYRGLSGDVRLALLDVEILMGDGVEVALLRKTRAGGNWLTGGIMVV